MKIFVAGLSYKTAPVELREKLAVRPARLRCHGCRLKLAGNLSELVVLSTCNRVEVYGVTPHVNGNIQRLFEQLSGSDFDFTPYLYVKEGAEAIQHLFGVTGGLDSMVIGETEITGQVKQAYQTAQEARMTGKVTNRLFQTALATAKEIRTQTGIGRGAASVGSVAVELAERIFDRDLSSKTVMIVGAGKMGEACVRHLAKKSARAVLVANRSFEKAQNLAGEFGGRAVEFEELLPALGEADIVVTSTGCPHTILSREDLATLMPARQNRPLFLIDIAVPRDIDADVQQINNVFLYNVDHLESIIRENVRLRESELVRCRTIIAERTAALMARFAPAPAPARETATRPHGSWALAGALTCSS
ncbi:MAG TPA: glutamyl-tRNA reductase [Candidatus Binatia bacterium]|jgi:glutamyl-tRNA reductase|nr:glutamyl-tRNA reductase [Candidatus Binatia bacterium]